ncbi:GH15149 [Drosophila grimshawi]|uniref:GH15149 n=2 Tax=Drosophila grimshawi TaxID=7222 RepID=B4IY77_DROGR|nr:GH15149 [Drosophila grimshawi]
MSSPYVYQLIGLLSLSCVVFGTEPLNAEHNHKKRQIYREQVLPHAGGKIPDTAFETDRLFLNRLQKEGISVPDGIVPEQRNPQVYQYYGKPMRTVYHIALSSDGRYTPREGRYHYRQVPTVETTYLYPQALGRPYVLVPPKHALPTYRQLQLHNPLLNQVKFQPKKMPNFLELTPIVGKSHASSSSKAQSYQNVNLLHGPALPAFKKTSGGSKTYVDSYGKIHLFSEFNDLLDKLDLNPAAKKLY